MSYETEVCICIPTKRRPPVTTLGSYVTSPYRVFIVADPDVYLDHCDFHQGLPGITVVRGVKGLAAQCMECYRVAHRNGFAYWFKMDDDLPPKTFVHKDGYYPELGEVIEEHVRCVQETHTTLVGPSNTSNRSWLGYGYGQTWGLIHGGANLSVSCATPEEFLDARIVRGEDIYRTCGHRRAHPKSRVGRVRHLGFDKSKSTAVAGNSSATTNQDAINASRDLILETFPDLVSCNGTREILNGKFTIPNWRMRR